MFKTSGDDYSNKQLPSKLSRYKIAYTVTAIKPQGRPFGSEFPALKCDNDGHYTMVNASNRDLLMIILPVFMYDRQAGQLFIQSCD